MAITAEFLDQLDRFNLVIHKRVTSNYIGTRESIASGQGLVFEDHRLYAIGDDYRWIDWKVYGRTDKLHIRRFEEERSLTVHILLDKSGSMKFMDKWDYAAMLGVGFAYLTMKENEKFQFSTFAEDIDNFRPKRGRQHLASMIHQLNAMKVSGVGDILKAARAVKKSTFSKALIIIISDFLYDLKEIETALALLSKNNLKIIQLFDKKEYDLAFKGEFKLKDAEVRDEIQTFISPHMQKVYKDKLGQHCAAIKKICMDVGAEYHLVTTEQPIFDVFFEVLRENLLLRSGKVK
ncbi:DUF58 domain-containing protein [Candidatus Woesearchaeota archaeon]|nr:DUF58 domain-containing protein [Candidatus Woesearchaeota archaeon]